MTSKDEPNNELDAQRLEGRRTEVYRSLLGEFTAMYNYIVVFSLAMLSIDHILPQIGLSSYGYILAVLMVVWSKKAAGATGNALVGEEMAKATRAQAANTICETVALVSFSASLVLDIIGV